MTIRNPRDIDQENSSTASLVETLTEGDISHEDESYLLEDDYESAEYAHSDEDMPIEYLEADANEEISLIEFKVEEPMQSSPPPLPVSTAGTSRKRSAASHTSDIASSASNASNQKKGRVTSKRLGRIAKNDVDLALNDISTGKTIHQLSLEYKVPRSTLYHKFRNDEGLKNIYRSERKAAMQQAINAVLENKLTLTKAAQQYLVPKTAVWRELRKIKDYQTPVRDFSETRIQAQTEILEGKSLTSISMKYGIPLTTVHRDKKRLSAEGKLPDSLKIKDRTENSEYGKRLEQALESCRQGMSQYQASKLYDIPKATMWRYANGMRAATTAKTVSTRGSLAKKSNLVVSESQNLEDRDD